MLNNGKSLDNHVCQVWVSQLGMLEIDAILPQIIKSNASP